MKAFLGRDSAPAVVLYIDLFIEGIFGEGPHPVDSWHLGRELVPYVRKFPQLKPELKRRYETVGSERARAMLEHFFSEAAEEDDLIAMVQKYAASSRSYDGPMAAAVRAVSLRHESLQDDSTSFYNIHPASVAHVRKALFGLLRGSPQVVALAERCLTAIDVLRDEHGIAANDSRHPDVMSERPWPPEAGKP